MYVYTFIMVSKMNVYRVAEYPFPWIIVGLNFCYDGSVGEYVQFHNDICEECV